MGKATPEPTVSACLECYGTAFTILRSNGARFITLGRLMLLQIMYKISYCTSHRTQRMSVRKTKQSMLFRGIVRICCENH